MGIVKNIGARNSVANSDFLLIFNSWLKIAFELVLHLSLIYTYITETLGVFIEFATFSKLVLHCPK